MKFRFYVIALVFIPLLFSACKKDTHSTSGTLKVYTYNGVGGEDSTLYTIVNGSLNIDAAGNYSTVAYSANETIDIAVLGQLVSGLNTLGSSYPTITVTTNPGNASTAYTSNSGTIILQGSTATLAVQLGGASSQPFGALLTGTINF